MNPLYVYKRVDVPGKAQCRFAVYDMSDVREKRTGHGEYVVPREVWSTRVVNFAQRDQVLKIERQAFEETCHRNGARPRRAEFREAIALKAQLKTMEDGGVRS